LAFLPYGPWVARSATCVVKLGGDEGEHIRTPGVVGRPATTGWPDSARRRSHLSWDPVLSLDPRAEAL